MIQTTRQHTSTVQTTATPVAAWRKIPSWGELAARRTLLLGFLLPCLLSSVSATDVSGPIVNQTWTSNNSPYRVVGDILIAGLTVNPGVTVRFAGNYNFEVAGVLRANGTPTAPIVFMGTNGGWQGIYFNYSRAGSILANCIISNSINSGVRILQSTPLLNNCIITKNSAPLNGGGILVSNVNTTSDLTLQNCRITGNTCGFNGGGICAWLGTNVLLVIEGGVINNNIVNPSVAGGDGTTRWTGGGLSVHGSLLMKYCVVQSNRCLGLDGVNTGGGIYTDYNGGANIGGGSGTRYGFVDLRNCIVSSNDCSGYTQTYGGGIYAFNASLAMTNSIVCGNATSSSANLQAGGGIYLNSSVQSASIINCTKSGPHSLDHETQKLS